MKPHHGLLLCMCSALGCAHHEESSSYPHSFDDVERFAKDFDDPRRDEWQRPDEVIKALELAPDAIVVDIGSGT